MDKTTNKFFHEKGTTSLKMIDLKYEKCQTSFIGLVPEWRTGITIKLSPKEEEIKKATKKLKDLLEECRERYSYNWTYNTL